ncbi:amino acid permease/ SLC12A domain-containing protein [Aspergillus avenaceus]|uniref:Amino acid permease/ SLC12A domain-containing protein n=1 Tax=Aspergillus avenaceus TaxID=36643 RepID=A0A5N6U916_ASPAV|nr:amino acid permease/ SLC12A domain-containing protein [Aspergillus avenaceus]
MHSQHPVKDEKTNDALGMHSDQDDTGRGSIVVHDGLSRSLAQGHLMMMAIGGVIGPGYSMGMGAGLSSTGPAGLLICFAVVGGLLWLVMQCLGELGSFIAVSGSFTHYTTRFVDPAVGFALGWNYFFLWAGIIMAEYNNLGLVLTYWDTAMPRWGWILIFWVVFMLFALLGVWAYGEAEFWLALFKVIAIAIFFICAILISTGVIGGQKVGFRYYHHPGAFADGVKGVFKIFVFAALQYSGTKMIGLTAGESRNPSRDIPKAVKSIIWRIVLIFLGGIFFLSITVPFNDPNLLGKTSKTASSPFVLAFSRVGATAGAHAVNAIILLSIFSAVNSAVYVGSRTLYGLAQEGAAPRILLHTMQNGSPIVALVVFHGIGFLSLLNLSSGAGMVYTWIISMTGVATFITWASICLCHLRVRKAMRLQQIPDSILPYRSGIWPWGTYLGLGVSLFFIFFQGWTSFAPWDLQAFFMNYIIVVVFMLLAAIWKVVKRTQWVRLETADLVSGRRTWMM